MMNIEAVLMFSKRAPSSEESLGQMLKTIRTQKVNVAFQSTFVVWASADPEESVKMSDDFGYLWKQGDRS